MTKAIITIQTQYQENNGELNSRWKNKGGQTFSVEIDTDTLMYGTDDLVPHLESLLVTESNCMGRYNYISHDVAFNKVVVLSQAALEASINKAYKYVNDLEEAAEALNINC
jgi:hypothetical protein|tara:strand:+ start:2324 stop:2656 length:333 start_codon:yes stop_codon:yes gene_type:complete